MALKRKRSSPTFSSPAFSDTSSSTTTSTDASAIPFFYQQSKPAEPIQQKPTWAWPTYDDTPSAQHLNSRTRKRHRDGRPDEQTVYGVSCWLGAVIHMSTLADVCRCAASTISKLYEAQRRHPDASPMPSAQSIQTPSTQPMQAQKSTLHSFWRIPHAPMDVQAMQIDAGNASSWIPNLRCEDCERPLRHDDAMELDDGRLIQEAACAVCRRHVCDTCAVLGNERICLGCASGR
ncbi:hypothetical protein LTR85_009534 [Meristemomyces frigidus]|nr:hypothetical protein LTR85_009534 [Meristemomyces frigidus]